VTYEAEGTGRPQGQTRVCLSFSHGAQVARYGTHPEDADAGTKDARSGFDGPPRHPSAEPLTNASVPTSGCINSSTPYLHLSRCVVEAARKGNHTRDAADDRNEEAGRR